MENMNFCPGLCRATWRLEFGAGLGRPLTLNCFCWRLVSWERISAYHILFREDIAVKGEAHGVPLHSLSMHEDCLTSGSPLCSYCAFFNSRSFYVLFSLPQVSQKKNILESYSPN